MRRAIKRQRRRAEYLKRRARPVIAITKSEPSVVDKPLMPQSWYDAVIAPAFAPREHTEEEIIADMRMMLEDMSRFRPRGAFEFFLNGRVYTVDNGEITSRPMVPLAD